MPSSNPPLSNWDFTPVINLLRSPTYSGGDQAGSSRHSDSLATPVGKETAEHATSSSASVPSINRGSGDSAAPQLGDFGSLWGLLRNASPPTARSEARAESHPEARVQVAQRPAEQVKRLEILQRPSNKSKGGSPPTPLKILKRPSNNSNNNNNNTNNNNNNNGTANNDDRARATPAKPIPIPKSIPKTPQVVSQRKPFGTAQHANRAFYDPNSSESNAEGESDGVFDTPLNKSRAFVMVPPQVGATAATSEPFETPPSSFDELDGALTPKAVNRLPRNGSTPALPTSRKSAKERQVSLLTKLMTNFPEYAETVAQMGQPTQSQADAVRSRPIHVFVDMSNIMVGFHDAVKVSRNIAITTRIRRLPLSFKNFSLILERGRPIAKRVLVGSDRFAAINEGERLGYEANILDRVHKVKHLTARQQRFRKNPSARAGLHDAVGGSGSETNDAPDGSGGERWVEQGVDEILHLKILESLLDTDDPATIVLATGDAAEAEFSGGFMKMVERALRRGWNVELVSFSKVTSNAYRRKEFRAKWRDQFQVMALDGYIEELLM
ncbi:hypothetical protein P168DRAFT_302305 [Aspergillus campestris IBT 28561]|uniref:NYN domain-containing protein n=1 Tax=Aspergillus campestris (strain IBT 28561) TaxID=1392248 RepID=A0A2I1DBX3_ASPC2|nr:uncharacterized protein P168DRAFT_302305 [Aspergillus campestris IBT 28561]PKY07360.1 hypothetical protein P168DRAFT_302305 [Aspergillus campestris IBT 28561]